jgi:hypothetical protein
LLDYASIQNVVTTARHSIPHCHQRAFPTRTPLLEVQFPWIPHGDVDTCWNVFVWAGRKNVLGMLSIPVTAISRHDSLAL